MSLAYRSIIPPIEWRHDKTLRDYEYNETVWDKMKISGISDDFWEM